MINNGSELHAVSDKENSEEATTKKPTYRIRTTIGLQLSQSIY